MKLIYENVDITSDIDIIKAEFTDSSGGKADSLELKLSDLEGYWSKWKPQKNHKISISENGLSSGVMYIDEIEQGRGLFIIRALSIPQEAKTHNTKSWESVRFLEFSSDIALKYGFIIETYGIENYLYSRVDQFDKSDFEFLSFRCMLEGFTLKIVDNKVVIYNEAYLESLDTVKTFYPEDFDGEYKFKSKSSGIYNSCEIVSSGIKSVYKPINAPFGPILKPSKIYVDSQGQGDRFAKNFLRLYNKYENTGAFTTELNTGITSGCNVNISGVGIADGKYFCEETKHNFINTNRTIYNIRKPLEGY